MAVLLGTLIAVFLLGFADQGRASESEVASALNRCTQLEAVLVTPDGGAVAAGSTWSSNDCSPTPGAAELVLIKFGPEGEIDQDFGTQGVSVVPARTGKVDGLLEAGDGRFLVFSDSEAFRFKPSGELDPAFADEGRLDQSDSGIKDADVYLGAVYLLQKVGGKHVISKFGPNGDPDSSFGDDGMLTTPLGPWAPTAADFRTFAIDQLGRFVLAGIVKPTSGPGAGSLTAGASRFDSTGAPDSTFGTGGFRHLEPAECNAGYCSSYPIDEVSIQPNGDIRTFGFESIDLSLAKLPRCDIGVIGGLDQDGHALEIEPHFVGDCEIGGLTDVLPNGDLIASNFDRATSTDPFVTSTFAVSRWNPESGSFMPWGLGSEDAEWTGRIPLTPSEQKVLATDFDPGRNEIVAVGYTGNRICANTCFPGRSLAIARFDATNGTAVSSFNGGGAVVLPENGCLYGSDPPGDVPSPVWNRCRVAPPANDVTARVLNLRSRNPRLVVQANPGNPPAGLWSTAQTLRVNVPGFLGPLSKISRQALGRGTNGSVFLERKSRTFSLGLRGDLGSCGYYEGCSGPDPTVSLRLVLSLKGTKTLRRSLRKRKVMVQGQLRFEPRAGFYSSISPSGWYAPNSIGFRTRVRVAN